MRIGFLIKYFYPKTGGAENNCYFLAREMVKRGHEVHVFCSGEKNSEENVEGINVHRAREIFGLTYYLAFYPSITGSLLKYDLDVLHIHGLGFIQHDLALSKLKKEKPEIKIVCTPHGPFMALNSYGLVFAAVKSAYMPLLKSSLKKYNLFFEVNPFQKEWMMKDYGILAKKIKFLPNGILREDFKRIPDKDLVKIKNKYNLKGKFVISYLGRIQRYKGVEQAIDSLPEILRLNENIFFVAIGKDAGDRERLLKRAKDLGVEKRVLFTGEVSEKEKLALLEVSEIFIFPSEWEAFGIVVLEAMSRGNVVISTRTEGGKYLVKEGENGYLFDYENREELVRKLSLVVINKSLREKMQKDNILKSKKYLWSDIAKDLEKFYEKVLGERNKS